MAEIAGRPYWQATFDRTGALQDDSTGLVNAIAAADVDELFVFAHGWNTDEADAADLIEEMFSLMAEAAAGVNLAGIGFLGVFWPSIWFPEAPAASAPAVALATRSGAPGQADVAVSGADIAASLAPSFHPRQRRTVWELGSLIDNGIAGAMARDVPDAVQRANVERFHAQLQTIVTDPTTAPFDSGEAALIRAPDPMDAYQKIATEMGSTSPGLAAHDVGDIFEDIWNGAKSALRVASYYEMKGRAGTVGTNGLGPLLAALHGTAPDVRVHLAGHSFGARLVSFSLPGLDSSAASPVASLTLVQGAFSHWAFADASMPFGQAGPLVSFRDRVHGPVLSTFSEHDWAVGIWYPKASFLADDMVTMAQTAPQWGGMGSDGAQWVPGPAEPTLLAASGTPYGLRAGQFYRFDSNAVIADTSLSPFAGAHSDIRHPQVAWLPVCAAAGL
ncbi:MAG TPA: hypothetical protein VF714_11830 [Jatrophihabitans sp.]|jgi:hypothetical protein